MNSPVTSTTQQVAADHLAISRRRPSNVLAVTALRTKSVYGREILAESAWPGHTPADLEEWAAANPTELPEGMNPIGLMSYARVQAVQLGTPADYVLARTMLEVAIPQVEPTKVPSLAIEMLLNLRILDGDEDGGWELVEHPKMRSGVQLSSRADLLNPNMFDVDDDAAWMEAFSATINSLPIKPYSLLPKGDPKAVGGDPAMDRLTVPDLEYVDHPARVTILMSAYQPDLPLLTAVRSAMEQTWRNVELFVVDDASGSDYAGILDQVEAMDPRVHVIRKAVNGGTYRARNAALRRSTGDFVMTLDSDDYLHPQGVESLVTPLLKWPGVMATRSQGIRVTEDLQFTRPGYRPRFTAAASLMFRLPSVVSRIGYFDTARKGADTEYALRILAAFGPKALYDIKQVFTVLRSGETLSSAEFSQGWRHGARHEYKSNYGLWHAAINAGEADPFLDPLGERKFNLPRRWEKPAAPILKQPVKYDICFAGDWRRFGGPQRSMLEEIAAAHQAGLKVAVMHLEAFRFMTLKDDLSCEPVVELVRDGVVEWLQVDDDADVDVLMVRYPSLLQYPPHVKRVVRAKQVLIMANQAPLEPDGSDQRYSVLDVTKRTKELFGVEPTWVPQSPHIRAVLEGQDENIRQTPWDNPGLIDAHAWHARRPRPFGDPVVIGRYSRDDKIKFASNYEDFVSGHTFDSGYQVNVMGGFITLRRLARQSEQSLDSLAENISILDHGSIEVPEFLAGLDFFLYLDNADANEAFGRVILEAAASGVLTVVHPKHRSTFGDAVDYAYPGEAQELIADYVADPQAYADRVARTREAVQERYGHTNFVAKLRELMPTSEPAPVVTSIESLGEVLPVTLDLPRSPARPRALEPSLSSDADQLSVTSMPVRALADGEEADSFAVVHVGEFAPILGWAADVVSNFGREDLHASMVASAPVSVLAIVTCRDGLAYLTAAAQIHGVERDEERLALAGPHGQFGWDERAWWARGDQARITLT